MTMKTLRTGFLLALICLPGVPLPAADDPPKPPAAVAGRGADRKEFMRSSPGNGAMAGVPQKEARQEDKTWEKQRGKKNKEWDKAQKNLVKELEKDRREAQREEEKKDGKGKGKQ